MSRMNFKAMASIVSLVGVAKNGEQSLVIIAYKSICVIHHYINFTLI